MKYKFVFFAPKYDWYRYIFKDAIALDNVSYYSDSNELLNPLEKLLHRLHTSTKINSIVKLPFQNVWNSILTQKLPVAVDEKVCFIWFSHFENEIKNGMVEYLRVHYPNSKHVYYYSDAKNINDKEIEILKEKMDFVTVFDPVVAEEKNLVFCPNPYPEQKHENHQILYDICFIGQDKGRREVIENIASECEKRGIKTAFFVKRQDGVSTSETFVNYLKNVLPYEETLDIVKQSRCVLELIIEPYRTCSLRIQEAIVLGKKIITNNRNIAEMPCCKGNKAISYFENTEDFDYNFCVTEEDVDYGYNGEYSARHFLKYIEDKFE